MTTLSTLWRYLPIAAAAAAQVVCAGLLLANMVLAAAWPGHQIKVSPGLHGVTYPEKPRLSAASLASTQYQQLYARLIGSRVPLYPAAVRLRNQVDYSVFGASATPSIIVGRHSELLERAYYDEYCSRDLASFLPKARIWAAQLRQIQDDAERRGQTFLYVVTPSKVAQNPQFLPAGLPCPASQADRDGFVPAWLQIVRQAGIHVVDTIQTLRAAAGDYPFALFARGGTHWNAVGASLATAAIDAGLNGLRHDAAFPPYRFTWHMTDVPQFPDTDLAELMNLSVPPVHFSVPVVTPDPAASNGCRPLLVVIVGGSFIEKAGSRMAVSGCHPRVVEYQYWQVVRFTWSGDKFSIDPIDPAERAQALMAADVLLYEENEQTIARSKHGPALYGFLSGQPGWRGTPSAKDLPQ